MKQEHQSLLKTIGFYILYIVAAFAAGAFSQRQMCAPGLGGAMLLLLMPLSVILLVASAIMHFTGKESYKMAVIVHASVIGLCMSATLFL